MVIHRSIIEGIKSSFPICLGCFPIGIAYGVIAKAQGMPLWFTLVLSLAVFAGSSQFIALQLLAAGAGMFEVLLTTFAINFRNFLMSSSVALRGPAGYSWLKKVLSGMTVTDETFAVISCRPEPQLDFGFVMGLQGMLYVTWNIGTLIGAVMMGDLGTIWNNSLGIAIYAMFISLVMPVVRNNRTLLVVAGVSGGVSLGLNLTGVRDLMGNSAVLLISAVAAAAIGAYLLSKGEAVNE